MPKKKIAVITRGGAAGGLFNQGIPALVELLDRIAERYDVHVFQSARVPRAESRSRVYPISGFRPRLRSLDLFAQIAYEHRRAPYTLIHGWWLDGAIHGLRVGRLLEIPVIVSLLGGEVARVPEIGYGGLLSERGRRRLVRACRRAAAVTTGSRFQRQMLEAVFDGHADVIYLGVDPMRFTFNPPPLRAPYEFIHVANLTEVKDQRTLIRAFAIIRAEVDCTLTIVGPDYLGDGSLRTLVAELGIDRYVRFSGPVAHAELPRYYHRAHLMLHTSLYEAQTVAALEAMATGVAVVGSDVGMLADLKDRCCLTAPPRDPRALATLALRLLAHPDRLIALRDAAHAWARRHTAQWTADRFMSLYEARGAARPRQSMGSTNLRP